MVSITQCCSLSQLLCGLGVEVIVELVQCWHSYVIGDSVKGVPLCLSIYIYDQWLLVLVVQPGYFLLHITSLALEGNKENLSHD